MSDKRAEEKKPVSKAKRLLRWGVVVVVGLTALGLLATWLIQRSLRTPTKKREIQLWLDENLNADIANMGEMVVRVNLVRPSRLVFHQTEILHPNATFDGAMAKIGRMGAWVPPWSVARLMPGKMELLFQDAQINILQNDAGEWSHDGLMRPLAVGERSFSFPLPKISEWHATVKQSLLSLQRRGYELDMTLNGEVFTRAGGKRITVRSGKEPFTFGPTETPRRFSGTIGPANVRLAPGENRGDMPTPIPGACEVTVNSLPISTLPFFVGGIPLEDARGVFHGLIRYDEHPGAAGAMFLSGELSDVPLAVFGLPPNSPLRLTWPINPGQDDLEARLHIGPSGFGAFEITVPLDGEGKPRLLSMRGDVAALDGIPALFSMHSRWTTWLSTTFPSVEWRSRAWRGFGWTGNNLRLSLSRATAGFNLTGEAEMMGGRVRISMSPNQPDAPITVAAERLDVEQLSAKMTRFMPAPFRIGMTGSHVNLTWRGFPSASGELNEWGTGMVWVKPVVDLSRGGSWWRGLSGIPKAMADALPEWGGGDPAGILATTRQTTLSLDQLSIVSEREENGVMSVEFRAYGDSMGQITGIVESRLDGTIEGEFLLAGSSVVLREVEKVNQNFALALELLANESPGLRVAFSLEPGGEPVFTYPFLQDAKKVHEDLLRVLEAQQ